MPTLTDYWNDEVSRIDAALANARTELATLRSELRDTEAEARALAAELKAHTDTVAAARQALAKIAMPADGDPLLELMRSALVDLNTARADVARSQGRRLALRAAASALDTEIAGLESEAGLAHASLDAIATVNAQRQATVDKFAVGGILEALVSTAQTALSEHEASARARVEGEFPTNANPDKSLLARARARAQLVRDIVASAASVEHAADAGRRTALDIAMRDYEAALDALLSLGEAGASVRADVSTLARLAALPAASAPDSFPILSPWQHALLHDSTGKTKRENTLAKLTAVDQARAALIPLQAAYDQARHAAMKAEPDKTLAELDATSLAAEKAALDTQESALDAARSTYTGLDPANLQLLDAWFAAIPDALWAALEALDGAVLRLQTIATGPTPASLDSAIDVAETALESALRSARAQQRQTLGSQRAYALAEAKWTAHRTTEAAQVSAMSHSNVLF